MSQQKRTAIERKEIKQPPAEKPKYLMFDHGGVLDGEVSMSLPGENDLLLSESFIDGVGTCYQIIKNGVEFINHLNELVDTYGYQVVFHSKNREEDQLRILKQLKEACRKKGLKFPKVVAMGVYDNDSKEYKNVSSDKPKIIKNREHGIEIAGWSADDISGKASLRRALEKLLKIESPERKNHVVFDDGPPNVATPIQEGYQAYKIGGEKGLSLNEAIGQVLTNARKKYPAAVRDGVIKKPESRKKETKEREKNPVDPSKSIISDARSKKPAKKPKPSKFFKTGGTWADNNGNWKWKTLGLVILTLGIPLLIAPCTRDLKNDKLNQRHSMQT